MKELTDREGEVEYSKESAEWAKRTSVCRQIVKTINEFGVNDYQRVKIIELLGLELEKREDMQSVIETTKRILDSMSPNNNTERKIIT